jgi:O-succinylbenzoate synthase
MPSIEGELVAVELVRVRLPLRRMLRSAHGEESVRDVVLVRAIGDDGLEGWGECSALEAPTYTGEYTDGAWAVLRDLLVPAALAHRDPRVVGHPLASTAVSTAICDLTWRRAAASGHPLPGPNVESGLPWTAVLGIQDSIDDLLAIAAEALGRGASALKLKVAPEDDLAPVRALIDAAPGVSIAVDANQGYDGLNDRVVALAELLARTDPRVVDDPLHARAYVEQPLPADDLFAHVRLAPRLAVPIALDESIRTLGDVDAAWTLGAAQLWNHKPARLDEPPVTRRSWPVATEGRPGEFLGGMLETGIGRAAALSSAARCECTDLGPSSWYFDEDITDAIELGDDRRMRPPVVDGFVPAPRADRLAEVVVDRLLIRR